MKLFLLLVLAFTVSVHAEIYRSVDENGNIIFSDEKKNNAEQIELSPTTVYTPEITIEQNSDSSASESAIELPEEGDDLVAPKYHLQIISPANDESVWIRDGIVTVSVLIEPGLDGERGDYLVVSLDSQTVSAPPGVTSVKFENVYRGTHSLAARVVDPNGKTLNSAKSIVFHLHR